MNPDTDGRVLSILCLAFACLVTTWVGFVNIILQDSRRNHSTASKEETGGDTLDGGEPDATLSERRINDPVHDWNENNEGDGVEIVDDIVWYSSELQSGGLRGKVGSSLVICYPEKRVPQEDGTSNNASSNFVNPSIIKCHPGWLVCKATGFASIPAVWVLEVTAPVP